jgi:lipoate-protein ligase A
MIWRLVEIEELDPYLALAGEEVALNSIGSGGDPIIRFWSWSRKAATIGSFQMLEDEIYADRCMRDDIPVIRRISGGGAMYHVPGNEFVFSLTAPPGVIDRDIARSYDQILSPIVSGLKDIGVEAVIADNNLMVRRFKISGSSQRRRKRAVLHHGTILYTADQEEMLKYIKGDKVIPSGKGTCSNYRPVAGISDLSDRSFSEVYRIVRESLLERKEYRVDDWTDAEMSEALRLVREKYGKDEWTLKLSI